MLRRVRSELGRDNPMMKLPPMIVETVFCQFDDTQAALYNDVVMMVNNALQGADSPNYILCSQLLWKLRIGMLLRFTGVRLVH